MKTDRNRTEGFIYTGYVQMSNRLLREISNKICAHATIVYLTILSHMNTKTKKCFPSYDLIANEVHLSANTVQKYIDKLYKEGYIVIESGTLGRCNQYYFPEEKHLYSDEELEMIKQITRNQYI